MPSVCDPAGPGFDKIQMTIETRSVAQYSQCIHTNSKGRGTEERHCDQNWHMGHCGNFFLFTLCFRFYCFKFA